MVAYSFHTRFAPDIQTGLKTHTMRNPRKRHARVGEPIQLYCKMRHPDCFKIIPDPICSFVVPVIVEVRRSGVKSIAPLNHLGQVTPSDMVLNAHLDRFAASDGFSGIEDMSAFWLKCHGLGFHRQVAISWGNHPFEELCK